MAEAQSSTLSPIYTFTIRQRAGLQVLDHALGYHVSDRDAAVILWAARERILQAAARRRMPTLCRLMQIAWRNPQAGAR